MKNTEFIEYLESLNKLDSVDIVKEDIDDTKINLEEVYKEIIDLELDWEHIIIVSCEILRSKLSNEDKQRVFNIIKFALSIIKEDYKDDTKFNTSTSVMEDIAYLVLDSHTDKWNNLKYDWENLALLKVNDKEYKPELKTYESGSCIAFKDRHGDILCNGVSYIEKNLDTNEVKIVCMSQYNRDKGITYEDNKIKLIF